MAPRDFALLMAMCLLWSVNNIVSKYVVSVLDVPPLFYAATRFAIVAICTLPFLLPAPRPQEGQGADGDNEKTCRSIEQRRHVQRADHILRDDVVHRP